jgi:hypothetical protein
MSNPVSSSDVRSWFQSPWRKHFSYRIFRNSAFECRVWRVYGFLYCITHKNKFLCRVSFKKNFFINRTGHIHNLFKDKFNMLEIIENKTLIIGKCYKLKKENYYKEFIVKRYGIRSH